MTDHLESKLSNIFVGKVRNRMTITSVSRFNLGKFTHQLDSPRLAQGFLKYF